jgi:cytochrome b subunit of formate dehydrogenase
VRPRRARPIAPAAWPAAPAFALAAALVLAAAVPRAAAQESDVCLACHAEKDLAIERKGRVVSLYVDASRLKTSVHGDLDCASCHAGLDPEAVPHAARIAPVDCRECHGDPAAAHPFHAAMARAPGTDGGPAISCKGCHGTHDVRKTRGPESKFDRARQPATCGACHGEVARRFRDSEHGRALREGFAAAPDCLGCHTHPLTEPRAEGELLARKVEQEKVCLSCHLEDPGVVARMGPRPRFIAAYDQSAHGRALHAGNPSAANCVDCHGSHDMKKGFEASSRVNRRQIPGTCGACHSGLAEQYARSVHGRAMERGVVESPVCTDCHGEHDIVSKTDPRSPVAPANISAQVCSPCHASLRLSDKFGLPADRPGSFADSFHGLALRGGGLEVAHCASCHGAHDILPSSDPASSVHKSNLVRTCGQCHPGASERFAAGSVHVPVRGTGEPIVWWIANIYIVLIVVVIGGMVVHNLLDFVRKGSRRLRARRGGASEEPIGHHLYLRMTLSERLQHGALLTSFIALVVTGFMLHYPEAWWVQGLRRLSARAFDWRGQIHRIAAVVLVAASLYHLWYLALTARGRAFLRDILPGPRDLSDAVGVLRHNLGLSRVKPRFGRFSYVEKSEYWAVVWGTFIMGATGVILWFEDTFIGMFTKLGWDIARTVHFYEAWLATLAILVWHFYYVFLNPDVYPMNLAWLTGTISEEEMADEHPLELEEIRKRRDADARPPAP